MAKSVTFRHDLVAAVISLMGMLPLLLLSNEDTIWRRRHTIIDKNNDNYNGGLKIRPHSKGIIYLLPLPLITIQKGFIKVLPYAILVRGIHSQQKISLQIFFLYSFTGCLFVG